MPAGVRTQTTPPQAPTPGELVVWLDNRETAWLAATHLQMVGEAAIPLLLQPGRITMAPHANWTASMLALAKAGEPAIPRIKDRVIAILREPDGNIYAATQPLITVLGAIGPASIPALLEIAEANGPPYVTEHALSEIARLEPRTTHFGQLLSPWMFWRPSDPRLEDLRRTLVPLLPRLRALVDRAAAAEKPGTTAPLRPAAYLLARLGTGDTRAGALRVLVDLSRTDDPFYANLESIRLLHALEAPETTSLIRRAAARIPDSNDMKGHYLLTLSTALHQRGDRDYASLLAGALGAARPYVRMDAARFIASSGHIPNGTLLVPLLEDRTEWNGQTVAKVALESLQRLTLESLDGDVRSWHAWFDANPNVSRDPLVARRVKAYLADAQRTPIWEMNRWIELFDGADGAVVLPLIDRYLERSDLDASAVGRNTSRSTGGGEPIGVSGPRVVTLLLEMAQRGVPGARQRLAACLEAADPQVRMFGALAFSAFDRPRAVERLAVEAKSLEAWQRNRAAEFLLRLGDRRGIPARLDTLASDQDASRLFACRDLRVYAQQPLACDPNASAPDREANVAAWHSWWTRAEPTFRVRTREAELDLQVFPAILPVSIGQFSVK